MAVTILLLTLVALTTVIQGSDDEPFNYQSPHYPFDCEGRSKCESGCYICPKGEECIINCIGWMTCLFSIIDATESSKLTINAKDHQSLGAGHIYCPKSGAKSDCIINIQHTLDSDGNTVTSMLMHTQIYTQFGFDSFELNCNGNACIYPGSYDAPKVICYNNINEMNQCNIDYQTADYISNQFQCRPGSSISCRTETETPTPYPATGCIAAPPPTTPSPTGNTASPTNNTPSPTDSTPSPTDNTASPTDNTPSPTDSTPAPTDNTPAPTNNTPSPTESTPSPTNNTPSPTNNTPSPTDSTASPTAPVPREYIVSKRGWYSWDQAKQECAGIDTTLATIITAQDQVNAKSAMINGNVLAAWIGINDIESEGTFEWDDGTPCDPSSGDQCTSLWDTDLIPDNYDDLFGPNREIYYYYDVMEMNADCGAITIDPIYIGDGYPLWLELHCDETQVHAFLCNKPETRPAKMERNNININNDENNDENKSVYYNIILMNVFISVFCTMCILVIFFYCCFKRPLCQSNNNKNNIIKYQHVSKQEDV